MRALILALGLLACGNGNDDDDDDESNASTIENVYRACGTAEDCDLPDVDPVCLDKAGEGFCTWECAIDDDCAESEEQQGDWALVCASFESNELSYCFPRCREIADTADPEGVCPSGFSCRSTGGGASNRKVCFPNDPGTTTTTSSPYP